MVMEAHSLFSLAFLATEAGTPPLVTRGCGHACSDCGKQLGYIAGIRGLGFRERRHAARCKLAGASTEMSAAEAALVKKAAEKVEADTKIPGNLADMIDASLASGDLDLAKVRMDFVRQNAKLTESLVAILDAALASGDLDLARFSIDLAREVTLPISGPAEMPKPQLLPIATNPHCPSGSGDPTGTLQAATNSGCSLQRNTSRSSVAIWNKQLPQANEKDAIAKAARRKQTILVTFRYTLAEHCQTPLTHHLENERRRLGINEHDWQTYLRMAAPFSFDPSFGQVFSRLVCRTLVLV